MFRLVQLLNMDFMLVFISKWGKVSPQSGGSFNLSQRRAGVVTKWGSFFMLQSGPSGINK